MKTTHIFGAAAAFAVLALASGAVSVSVSTPAVAQAAQDDQIATTNGNLVIHPVHHAGVVLTWNGKRIVADPTTFPPGPEQRRGRFQRRRRARPDPHHP